jgi:glycosyltransferase involved in cell wall biosynthesis
MSRLRIGLDLSIGTNNWLGGLYYLENLVLAIRTLPEEDQPDIRGFAPVDDPDLRLEVFSRLLPIVAFRGGRPRATASAKLEHRVRLLVDRRPEPPYGVARAARAIEADVLFPTLRAYVRPTAHLPWIYDVQHYHLPQNFSERERRWRDRAFRHAARTGDLVVVSSGSAAADIAARLPEAEPKLRVLRFTTVPKDEWFEGEPGETRVKYGLPPRFLLCPGQFWVHKNHLVAFQAVRHLRNAGIDVCLVCTGSTEDYRAPTHFTRLQRFVEAHDLATQIRVLGIVPRSDYFRLLRGAVAVVQPSLFEGWSSVVEDARALGKRMVLSDIPVHREQDAPRATYFAKSDSEALAAELEAVVNGAEQNGEPRSAIDEQTSVVRAYARSFLSIADEAATLVPTPAASLDG